MRSSRSAVYGAVANRVDHSAELSEFAAEQERLRASGGSHRPQTTSSRRWSSRSPRAEARSCGRAHAANEGLSSGRRTARSNRRPTHPQRARHRLVPDILATPVASPLRTSSGRRTVRDSGLDGVAADAAPRDAEPSRGLGISQRRSCRCAGRRTDRGPRGGRRGHSGRGLFSKVAVRGRARGKKKRDGVVRSSGRRGRHRRTRGRLPPAHSSTAR